MGENIKHNILLIGLISFSFFSNAALSSNFLDRPVDPYEIADLIVVYKPKEDMPLNKLSRLDREFKSSVTGMIKGNKEPLLIVNRAGTIIAPLESNKPIRLFLKKFQDRDGYYPIAIFPVNQSNNSQH